MKLQLPATLRAIEAGKLLPVVWEENLPGSTQRHAVVGAAWAELDLGGVWLSAEIAPSSTADGDGYAWTVVGPESDDILLHGVAPTLADAKACAAVAATALAADILAI